MLETSFIRHHHALILYAPHGTYLLLNCAKLSKQPAPKSFNVLRESSTTFYKMVRFDRIEKSKYKLDHVKIKVLNTSTTYFALKVNNAPQ